VRSQKYSIATPPASSIGSGTPPSDRLRFAARRLHALGPRPLYEFLLELADGADPWSRLERYASLDGDFIATLGGDELPTLRCVRTKGR
jgi:hypothetical protein